ncbi:MAG: alpha-ketoacid dehydrogenase subunit beta [Deltaproteobacteria bacterium]|nr:alpha-ketoacid dehydrogenase subunit beta [Deltaproteobacteria bacterium]
MATHTTASAIRATLHRALEERDDVVLLGESMGRGGGVAGTTRGLQQRFGEDRVIDLPVADRAAVGLAVGLALGGRTAVVEVSTTGRLTAVFEVLAEAASVASDGEFRVPLVVRVPTGTEAGNRVDRPAGDLLATVPGLSVVCGSTPETAAGLLEAALRSDRPVVLLEPRALYHQQGEVSGNPIALDRARVVREGEHVTLVGWGASVPAARQAAEDLHREDVSAQVVDLVSLSPVDEETLGAAVRRTGRIVAVHPDDSALAERLLGVALQRAFLYLESPPAIVRPEHEAMLRVTRESVFY